MERRIILGLNSLKPSISLTIQQNGLPINDYILIKYIDGTLIKPYGLLIIFMNAKITLVVHILTHLETSLNLLLKHKSILANLDYIHIAIFSSEASLCNNLAF